MTENPYLPTIDDLINLPDPADVQISPDGRYVAYVVNQPDWDQNERVGQVWLAGETLPEPIQLTFTKKSSRLPRWSPDGKWLAFLSQRGEDKNPQIYKISPFGGEAQSITKAEGSVGTFAWSPDGRQIAFTLTESENEVHKKRKEKFGDYRVDDEDYQRAQLWLLNTETIISEKLTGDNQYHIVDFDWSPGGEKIVFEAWPSPDMKDFTHGSLHVIDIHSQKVDSLVTSRISTPRWSPDGKNIAFTRYKSSGMVSYAELCTIPINGGEPFVLNRDLDMNPMLQDWGENGFYFSALKRTGAHLYCLNPKTGSLEQITPDEPGWIAIEYSFSADFAFMACVAADQQHYGEVFLFDIQQRTQKQLTHFNETIKDWQYFEKEAIQWTSQDGTQIEGVLTKPLNFDPTKKYPLLVIIHGGPTWISVLGKLEGPEKRFYPAQQWAAKGALILEPNYRGSAGYGEAFMQLNMRNLGLGDYWDVISGVDALIAKGWVNPERVGSMGWSQGGYISAFITTYSDRFKAVSVGAGISNWVTYYVNTDIHPFTREYLKATPWEDMEIYKMTSPMTYIKNAKTPTLIQHGDQDFRVPIPNAFELYQGLLDMGVESRLIVYPGMPHSTTKPRTQRQIMQSNLEWFNRWIWGEQPDVEKETTLYVTLAYGDKVKEKENLRVIERYQGKLVQDVHRWAHRDEVGFYIFSGEFGLVDEDFPSPPDELALLPEDVSPMSIRITETLRDDDVRKLVFFTPPAKENPWVLIYLGCLQVAAGLAAKVSIEHREIEEKI